MAATGSVGEFHQHVPCLPDCPKRLDLIERVQCVLGRDQRIAQLGCSGGVEHQDRHGLTCRLDEPAYLGGCGALVGGTFRPFVHAPESRATSGAART